MKNMLTKFNNLCKKIILESSENDFKIKIKVGYYFSPAKAFAITEDMLIGNGFTFKESNYAGQIKEILSNDEIILTISGIYINSTKTYNRIKCKLFDIKYKLTYNDIYYIQSLGRFELDNNNWSEIIFKPSILDNITNQQGQCACGGGGDAGGSISTFTGGESSGETAIDSGITTNNTFGDKNNACEPIIPPHSKDIHSPGITTADMRAMYTLYMNPKNIKNYPLFKRISKKKKKKKS